MLSTARIEHQNQATTFTFPDPTVVGGVEALMHMLMQRWASEASLSVGNRQIAMRPETTLAQALGTTYTLTSANGRVTTLDGPDELRHACDAGLASILAQDLGSLAGGGWKCNVREASLTRIDGDGKSGSAWVAFDGDAGALSFNTPTQKISWRIQDRSEKSLHEAWSDMLR